MIDFNTSPPSIKYFNIFMRLVDCSSICDENGSLLFYTNNCALYDQNHIYIENSGNLNPGTFDIDYCQNSKYGYPTKTPL